MVSLHHDENTEDFIKTGTGLLSKGREAELRDRLFSSRASVNDPKAFFGTRAVAEGLLCGVKRCFLLFFVKLTNITCNGCLD